MDRASILNLITTYVQNTKPDFSQDQIKDLSVSDVFTSSFDVIEFLMHLEDELTPTQEIDFETMGPKIAQNMTFSELADEIITYLNTHGQS